MLPHSILRLASYRRVRTTKVVGIALGALFLAAARGVPTTNPASTSTTVPASIPATTPVDPAAIKALTDRLVSPDWRQREQSLSELVHMGDGAIPALDLLIRTTDHDEVRIAARSVLKQIAENRVVGTSYVTLHLKDVSPKQAFESLARQSFASLKPFPDDLWDQMGQAKISVDVDRQPFWVAMCQLCKQTSIELTEVNGQLRLTRGGSRIGGRYSVVAGAFLVVANQAVLNRTVDFSADDPPVEEDFSMQFNAYPEPKLRVLRVNRLLVVREAVDDKGNSLIPDPAAIGSGAPEDFEYVIPGAGDGSFPISTQFKHPKNPGVKLARLRASVGFRVQVASQIIELKDLKTLKDATRTVNGVRVVFNDFRKEQEQYLLRISVVIDPTNPAIWEELQADLAQRLRLLDAKGQPLENRGFSGSNTVNNQVELTMAFYPSQRPEDGRATGEPASLVWEVPTQTRDILVPFELKDLKLP